MADRPRLAKFTVRGKTRFPLDMLRYDVCVPASPEDVGQIEASLMAPGADREVTLLARADDRRCTVGRWASFGWPVVRGFLEDGEPWRPERPATQR